jgi:hypothetical protein
MYIIWIHQERACWKLISCSFFSEAETLEDLDAGFTPRPITERIAVSGPQVMSHFTPWSCSSSHLHLEHPLLVDVQSEMFLEAWFICYFIFHALLSICCQTPVRSKIFSCTSNKLLPNLNCPRPLLSSMNWMFWKKYVSQEIAFIKKVNLFKF